MVNRRSIQTIIGILVLAAVYYAAGKFGLSLAFLNRNASAVWPPSGIALAALLLLGQRLWPGVFLGAFLVNVTTQGSLLTSLGIAAGNTLEVVIAAALTCRFAGGLKAFDRTDRTLKFFGLAAIASTAISATLGVVSLCIAGLAPWDRFGSIWLTWWLGDAVSNLVVAPLLMIWCARPFPVLRPRRILEGCAMLVAIVVVGEFIFARGDSSYGRGLPLEYLAIPPLLWAAVRFRRRGAILSCFVLSGLALWGTLHGYGPFARGDTNESLLLLQGFIGTLTLSMLVLAAATSERKRAEDRLVAHDKISRTLAELPTPAEARARILQYVCEMTGWDTAAIWQTDLQRNQIACVEFWRQPGLSIPDFEAATRHMRLDRGTGLPGRVWGSGAPVWIEDVSTDSNFPRVGAAVKDGLCSAVAFPVQLPNGELGVIECFSLQQQAPDEPFMQTMGEIARQYGQFIERKRGEEALRESEARFRALADNIPQLAWMTDASGSPIWHNKRFFEFTGTTPEEMHEQGRRRLHHTDHINRVQEKFRAHMESGNAWEDIFPLRRSDGVYRWFLSRAFPIRDESGRITRWFGTNTDITELRDTEQALQQAREKLQEHASNLEKAVAERTTKLRETIAELEAFSYSLSHDMRAPLRAIQSFTQVVLTDFRKEISPEAASYLNKVVAAAIRMDRLIQDVLLLTRISRQEIEIRKVSLDKLVDEIVDERPELQRGSADVTINAPLGAVLAHEASLTQCITNILSNAVKFVAPAIKPRVRIWSEPRNGKVRLWIEDNGIGIDKPLQDRLFKMFERLHPQSDYEGTGIGLAIVRRAVERMKGEVGVESEPGKGSRFWLELPVA
jgi:PAS domain S-box-containing protein